MKVWLIQLTRFCKTTELSYKVTKPCKAAELSYKVMELYNATDDKGLSAKSWQPYANKISYAPKF